MSSRRKIAIGRALQKIRAAKPQTHKDFKNLGLRLRWVGSGIFRECCEILNCDLVVKFPLAGSGRLRKSSYKDGIEHSDTEVDRIKRLAKFAVMRPHLPEVFYHDKQSGILVMRKYPKYATFETQVDAMGQMIQRLVYKLTKVRCSDIHSDNVRKRRFNNEQSVLVDLGY